MKMVKIICAWCKKDLGEQEVSDDAPDAPSHGICKKCREEHFPRDPAPSEGEKIR